MNESLDYFRQYDYFFHLVNVYFILVVLISFVHELIIFDVIGDGV